MSTSESLPPVANLFEGDGAARQAYERLLPLEDQQEPLIRILGQMLIQAPSLEGRAYVAGLINRCATDQQIFHLGAFYLNHFVNICRKPKTSRTPSTCPSRPSFDAIRQDIANSLLELPKDHSEAKRQALVRDNYRCMLSGIVDSASAKALPHLAEELGTRGSAGHTRCTHILPQYISHRVGDDGTKRDNAANVWAVVRLFGGISDQELSGSGIHELCNTLTLGSGVHDCFSALEIWLEPIEGTEHQYRIGRQMDWILRELPPVVTFSSTSAQLKLPDRRYLALHAACARVIKLSGAGEYIERILQDAEQTKVLAEDGSSSELLGHLLFGEFLAY